MVGRNLSLVLMVLLVGACSNRGPVTPDTPEVVDLSDREYSVLAAILDSVYHRPPDSLIVLEDSTDSGMHGRRNLDSVLTLVLEHASRILVGLTEETQRDYKTKNLTRTYVGRPPQVHPGCVRSSSTARDYPLMSVGRVGFDTSGTQALAYVGYMYAAWQGGGNLYLLSRDGQGWRIVGVMVMWMA